MELKEQLIHIKKIQEQDNQRSYSLLLESYKPLIKTISIDICNKFKHSPIEVDDMMNVLSLEFYYLIKSYDKDKGMFFPSYVKKFLVYKGMNYSRQYITNGHKALNYNNWEENFDAPYIPEEEIDFKDFINGTKLTVMENDIMLLFHDGFSLQEIANKLGKSKQTVFATKKRALYKISKNH